MTAAAQKKISERGLQFRCPRPILKSLLASYGTNFAIKGQVFWGLISCGAAYELTRNEIALLSFSFGKEKRMVTFWSQRARFPRALVMPLLLSPFSASAHVELASPYGGESLVGGSNFSIQWQVAVEHDTVDWDLWYSITSADGPWTTIALGLPVGDPTSGANHQFDWTVPPGDIGAAWVRVQQDNMSEDYQDVSDHSFRIAAAVAGDFTRDGAVDGQDLNAWQQGFGQTNGVTPPAGDADGDGNVDGADLLAWQLDLTGTAATRGALLVPEPATRLLGVAAVALLVWHARHLQ